MYQCFSDISLSKNNKDTINKITNLYNNDKKCFTHNTKYNVINNLSKNLNSENNIKNELLDTLKNDMGHGGRITLRIN